jgi:hypothetical protein
VTLARDAGAHLAFASMGRVLHEDGNHAERIVERRLRESEVTVTPVERNDEREPYGD